jgi:hypothetical protein
MIPALEAVIKYGGQRGVREIVYGMAHRGRLNVLANVMERVVTTRSEGPVYHDCGVNQNSFIVIGVPFTPRWHVPCL